VAQLRQLNSAACVALAGKPRKKLAFREGWRRIPGNDGATRVLVPAEWLKPVREPSRERGREPSRDTAAFETALTAIEAAHAARSRHCGHRWTCPSKAGSPCRRWRIRHWRSSRTPASGQTGPRRTSGQRTRRSPRPSRPPGIALGTVETLRRGEVRPQRTNRSSRFASLLIGLARSIAERDAQQNSWHRLDGAGALRRDEVIQAAIRLRSAQAARALIRTHTPER
jgi:hypothetical protein